MPGREKLRLIAAVPFSYVFRGVSFVVEQFRNCYFVRIEPDRLTRVGSPPLTDVT